LFKRTGFYDVTVCAAGIAACEIGRIVGRGEDDDGDRGEAGIGPESFQKIAAIPSPELEIEEDKRGEA
jgi:hypothetical protein